MNDPLLPLPARRALPSPVRERMRRRVLTADLAPVKRPNRRGPLVAAAVVALLAAGGGIVAQSTRGGTPPVAPPTSTAANPTRLDVTFDKTTDADLAKCAAAGMASTYTVVMPGRRIVVGDGPTRTFCEITYTRVSVSPPAPTPIPLGDGSVSVLWRSPSGVVVGQAPRSATTMRVESEAQPKVLDDLPKIAKILPGGLFVLRTASPVDRVEFRTSEPNASVTARVVQADLPGPEWSTSTDAYPGGGTPDRPTNQAARCFDTWLTDGPPYVGEVPASFGDPAAWRWTQRVGQDDERGLLVLRDDQGDTAYCSLRAGLATGLEWAREEGKVDHLFRVLGTSQAPDGGVTILAGTVDPVVGYLEFQRPGARPTTVEVVDGTFAVLLKGPAVGAPLRPQDFEVKVSNSEGNPLYQGPVE